MKTRNAALTLVALAGLLVPSIALAGHGHVDPRLDASSHRLHAAAIAFERELGHVHAPSFMTRYAGMMSSHVCKLHDAVEAGQSLHHVRVHFNGVKSYLNVFESRMHRDHGLHHDAHVVAAWTELQQAYQQLDWILSGRHLPTPGMHGHGHGQGHGSVIVTPPGVRYPNTVRRTSVTVAPGIGIGLQFNTHQVARRGHGF
ncbi:MAG: hypothetical protein KDB14_12525 [Planctomycetales bacterium]|nr:hypothetical protein [Planctomycetales bacterium]